MNMIDYSIIFFLSERILVWVNSLKRSVYDRIYTWQFDKRNLFECGWEETDRTKLISSYLLIRLLSRWNDNYLQDLENSSYT